MKAFNTSLDVVGTKCTNIAFVMAVWRLQSPLTITSVFYILHYCCFVIGMTVYKLAVCFYNTF